MADMVRHDQQRTIGGRPERESRLGQNRRQALSSILRKAGRARREARRSSGSRLYPVHNANAAHPAGLPSQSSPRPAPPEGGPEERGAALVGCWGEFTGGERCVKTLTIKNLSPKKFRPPENQVRVGSTPRHAQHERRVENPTARERKVMLCLYQTLSV